MHTELSCETKSLILNFWISEKIWNQSLQGHTVEGVERLSNISNSPFYWFSWNWFANLLSALFPYHASIIVSSLWSPCPGWIFHSGRHPAHQVHYIVRRLTSIERNNIICQIRKLELDHRLIGHSWLCFRLQLRWRQTTNWDYFLLLLKITYSIKRPPWFDFF